MTLQHRQVADVAILDIDGRITIQDGADEFRAVARQLLALSRVRLVPNLQLVPTSTARHWAKLFASTPA